jgi:hypothetical protein
MNGQLHSQRNLQAQLKTAQANARPKFLIELAKPIQKEFKNIFSNASKKIKNATHSRHDNDTETQY